METKLVKVTEKGQISIPTSMRKATGIKEGDEILVVQEGPLIVIERVKKSDFSDLLKHSERVAQKLWGTPADDIWDTL